MRLACSDYLILDEKNTIAQLVDGPNEPPYLSVDLFSELFILKITYIMLSCLPL